MECFDECCDGWTGSSVTDPLTDAMATSASDAALADLRRKLAGDDEPLPEWERELLSGDSLVANQDDAMLTVVFLDGREVTVPIMVPTVGEAVVMRDGLVLAENRAMRLYTFPNVSHWYTESI